MGSVGKLENFDGKDWEQYTERLEQYLIANDLEEIALAEDQSNEAEVTKRSEKRKAILLSALGGETYNILRNLVSPSKPSAKSYVEIITGLKTYFSPKLSIIVQRYKFSKRERAENESVTEYLSSLRQLAENCEFNDLEDRLRDQLLLGVNNTEIQRKLLLDEGLTLKSAYDTALSIETASKNMTVITNSTGTINRMQEK